jgi:uncharacterized membrane protein
MNKLLVVVFDKETEAYEGLRALRDLHRTGDVTVYSTAVVAKDAAGTVSVKQAADEGPIGLSLGLLTGSLLGLLGGPIGLAIGATTGSLAGMILDLTKAGIDADFLAEVSAELMPNRAAVLAEVDEPWITPVDVRLGKMGARIFRAQRSDVIEDYLNREADTINAELTALQAELAKANAEHRAALQARIDQAQQKLQALQAQIEAKQAELQNELNAKINALREQAKTASQARKAEIEQRVAEMKAEAEARGVKLNKANTLIKEALGPSPKAQAKRQAIEDKLRHEAAEFSAALKALQAELAQASVQARAALQARLDDVTERMGALETQVETTLDELERELKAKVDALREQAKTASQARKAEIEQRVAETTAEYEARRAKLTEAGKLIKEALAPKAHA